MFAELCSAATVEHPEPSIEQFLDLQQVLSQATAVAGALAGVENLYRDVDDAECRHIDLEQFRSISMEKARRANLWVNAALSTDMAAFSLMTRQTCSSTNLAFKKDLAKGKAMLVLERASVVSGVQVSSVASGALPSRKGATSVIPSHTNGLQPSSPHNGNEKRSMSGSEVAETKQSNSSKTAQPMLKRLPNGVSSKIVSTKPANKTDWDCHVQGPSVPLVGWGKGDGLQETAELAKRLSHSLIFFGGCTRVKEKGRRRRSRSHFFDACVHKGRRIKQVYERESSSGRKEEISLCS